jgi:hypothetical protein
MATPGAYEHLGIKFNNKEESSDQTAIFWGDYGKNKKL